MTSFKSHPSGQPAGFDPAIVMLHDYSKPDQRGATQARVLPTLVVSPLALHDAALADMAPRYSLMETLQAHGVDRLVLIEWISATRETAHHTISTQVTLLDRIVDHYGGCVNLIGLCQGGWLALVYTALFPDKVRRLVMVGAPVDFHAHIPHSMRWTPDISQQLTGLGLSLAFDYWTAQWAGLARQVIHGRDIRWLWPYDLEQEQNIDEALQIPKTHPPAVRDQAISALKDWDQRLLDLPAPYFWQVAHWLYRDNRLAQGNLYVLDRRVALQAVTCPLYLLAGENDHVVSIDQILATIGLVGTPAKDITLARAPCGHLALFMGHETLTRFWPAIAKWIIDDF